MKVAAIVMSFAGPLAGVFVAWMLSRRAAKRDSAHALFSRIFVDMQNYQHCLVRFYLLARTPAAQRSAFPLPFDPQMEMKIKEADLNADVLMLGLHFDSAADKAGMAIHALISLSGIFDQPDNMPPLDALTGKLAERIREIGVQIKALNRLLPTEGISDWRRFAGMRGA